MHGWPISEQVGAIKLMTREEHEEGFLEALNRDRKRYEEAYKKGWDDCKKHYKEKLARIAKEATD